MDPRRAAMERNAHFTRGPRFFRDGDAVMFEFVIDAGNVIGPRPARVQDVREHFEAFRAAGHYTGQEMAAMGFETIPAGGGAPAQIDEPERPMEQVQGPPAKRAYTRRKSRDAEA